MASQTGTEFHRELLAVLPRLRSYALSLTGDRERADELVQSTVVKALAQQASFKPGTNLGAWLFRIQRNTWIDTFRRRRPTEEINEDTAAVLSTPPSQEAVLIKAEFLKAFARLHPHHREALVLSVIEGQPYERIAAHAGVSIGTIKSRVCRARDRLLLLMTGEKVAEPVEARPKRRRRADGEFTVTPPA
jgi:RNA polymerase sigma-70 factor (ECF subfamily)